MYKKDFTEECEGVLGPVYDVYKKKKLNHDF